MKVTNLNVDLSKRYITEPLHKDALVQVSKDSNFHTAHRLFLVTNELKERYYFLELDDHDKYTVTAAINVRYTYGGQAKTQIESVAFLRPLLKHKNQYTVSYTIRTKKDLQEVFSFKHTTKSQQEVCELIDKLRQKTNQL